MTRRIILLVGSFLTLGLVIWIYHYFVASGIPDAARRVPAAPAPAQLDPNQLVGLELNVQIRDPKTGRLERVFMAKKWTKLSEEKYQLTEPKVEVYQRRGQRVYIGGDEGTVLAQEAAGGFRPRRGSLKGHVEVIIDNATAYDRPPMEERPDDLIKIYVDDVEFDSERLEIKTDSPLELRSASADLQGQGLEIRWDEAPEELRELHIWHGKKMVIRNVPEEFSKSLLSGAAPGATAGSAPAGAAEREVRRAEAAAPAEGELAAAAKGSSKRNTVTSQGSKGPRQNIYQLKFNDNVNVETQGRQIRNAKELALIFERDFSREGGEGLFGNRPKPASGPSGEQAARKAQRGPMTITWTGPLSLIPVGHADNPSDNRYDLSAIGDELVLADEQTTIYCKKFFYALPGETARVEGAAQDPAHLHRNDGTDMFSQVIRVDRLKQEVYMDGPGRMTRSRPEAVAAAGKPGMARTSPAALAAATGETLAMVSSVAPAGPTTRPNSQSISWKDSAQAKYGEEKVRQGSGSGEPTQYIEKADFKGAVELLSGKSDEEIHCDNLSVWMTKANEPARAFASGHVFAKQPARDIEADEVTLFFEPGAVDAVTGKRADPEPTRMEANGRVRVTGQENQKGFVAIADTMVATSDPLKQTAVLTGRPASVSQGIDKSISGDKVNFEMDETGLTASVQGKGTMQFLTNRDLSGEKIDKSIPVVIGWSDGMKYSDARRAADFSGAVALNSGLSKLNCRDMTVYFESPMAASQPTTQTAKTASARKGFRTLAVGMGDIGSDKIRLIDAGKDVVLTNTWVDEQNLVLQRVWMESQKLTYDVQAQFVRATGPGKFYAEDHRPGNEKDKAKADKKGQADAIGGLERPWQTIFDWSTEMLFSQANRTVQMHGNVGMVHLSGKQMITQKDIKTPPVSTMPEGRNARLRCDSLFAVFSEAAKEEQPAKAAKEEQAPKAASAPPAQGVANPRLGSLESFQAIGGVNLIDGTLNIICQRLEYDRPTETATVWGSLPGQPAKEASMFFTDAKTQRFQKESFPKAKIFFDHLKGNEVVKYEIEKISGGGSR